MGRNGSTRTLEDKLHIQFLTTLELLCRDQFLTHTFFCLDTRISVPIKLEHPDTRGTLSDSLMVYILTVLGKLRGASLFCGC